VVFPPSAPIRPSLALWNMALSCRQTSLFFSRQRSKGTCPLFSAFYRTTIAPPPAFLWETSLTSRHLFNHCARVSELISSDALPLLVGGDFRFSFSIVMSSTLGRVKLFPHFLAWQLHAASQIISLFLLPRFESNGFCFAVRSSLSPSETIHFFSNTSLRPDSPPLDLLPFKAGRRFPVDAIVSLLHDGNQIRCCMARAFLFFPPVLPLTQDCLLRDGELSPAPSFLYAQLELSLENHSVVEYRSFRPDVPQAL